MPCFFETKCQVPLQSKALYSSCIACFHHGSSIASCTDSGSPVDAKQLTLSCYHTSSWASQSHFEVWFLHVVAKLAMVKEFQHQELEEEEMAHPILWS